MKKTIDLKDASLEEDIAQVHTAMKSSDPTSEEYQKLVKMLRDLYALRPTEKESKPLVSYDIIAGIVGNLALGLIFGHLEKTMILTSKAWNLIVRNRT